MRAPVTQWLNGIQAAQYAAVKSYQPGLTIEVFLLWFSGVLVMACLAKRLYLPVFAWVEKLFWKSKE